MPPSLPRIPSARALPRTSLWNASLAILLAATGALGVRPSVAAAPDVVVHVGDLPKNAVYELEPWKDRLAAGGKLLGVTNNGDELDPPPENDPHALIKVPVQAGVPYRVWLHMKVGKPKGKSKANMVYAQFTDAVDAQGQDILKPKTKSYLTLEGPAKEGWVWVGSATPKVVTFKTGGTITVRLQAGMEGVGFDQLVLSPARFLDKAPVEAIVKK